MSNDISRKIIKNVDNLKAIELLNIKKRNLSQSKSVRAYAGRSAESSLVMTIDDIDIVDILPLQYTDAGDLTLDNVKLSDLNFTDTQYNNLLPNIDNYNINYSNVKLFYNADDTLKYNDETGLFSYNGLINDNVVFLINFMYNFAFKMQLYNGYYGITDLKKVDNVKLTVLVKFIFNGVPFISDVNLTDLFKMMFYVYSSVANNSLGQPLILLRSIENLPYSNDDTLTLKSSFDCELPVYTPCFDGVNAYSRFNFNKNEVVNSVINNYNVNTDVVHIINNVNIGMSKNINNSSNGDRFSVITKCYDLKWNEFGSETENNIELTITNDNTWSNLLIARGVFDINSGQLSFPKCTIGRRITIPDDKVYTTYIYSETELLNELFTVNQIIPTISIIRDLALIDNQTVGYNSYYNADSMATGTFIKDTKSISLDYNSLFWINNTDIDVDDTVDDNNFTIETTDVKLSHPSVYVNTILTILGSNRISRVLTKHMPISLVKRILNVMNGEVSKNVSNLTILNTFRSSSQNKIVKNQFLLEVSQALIDCLSGNNDLSEQLYQECIDDENFLQLLEYDSTVIEVPEFLLDELRSNSVKIDYTNNQVRLSEVVKHYLFNDELLNMGIDLDDTYKEAVDKYPESLAPELQDSIDKMEIGARRTFGECSSFEDLKRLLVLLFNDFNGNGASISTDTWEPSSNTSSLHTNKGWSWLANLTNPDGYGSNFTSDLIQMMIRLWYQMIIENNLKEYLGSNIIECLDWEYYTQYNLRDNEESRYPTAYVMRNILFDHRCQASNTYWAVNVDFKPFREEFFTRLVESVNVRNQNYGVINEKLNIILAQEYNKLISDNSESKIEKTLINSTNNIIVGVEDNFYDLCCDLVDDICDGINQDSDIVLYSEKISSDIDRALNDILGDDIEDVVDQYVNNNLKERLLNVRDQIIGSSRSYMDNLQKSVGTNNYVESFKESMYLSKYANNDLITNATNSVSNIINVSTDLGWMNDNEITSQTNLQLALGSDFTGIVGKTLGCVLLMARSVDQLAEKFINKLKAGLTDGVSVKVRRHGLDAFNIASSSITYSIDRFKYLYYNLYRSLVAQGCFPVGNLSYTVIDSCGFYIIIQGIGTNQVIVSLTPKINFVKEDFSLSNDFNTYEAIVNNMYDNLINFNNVLDCLSEIDSTVNQFKIDLTNFKQFYINVILDKSESINRTKVITAKSIICGLGVAAGVILCCTGYGSVAGVALIAGATYLGMKAVGDTPEKNLEKYERLKEDEGYANSIVSSNDFRRLLRFNESEGLLKGLLMIYNTLSNVILDGTDCLDSVSLVHNGSGISCFSFIDDLGNSDIIGFIPCYSESGIPRFKLSLVTDSERLVKYITAAATVAILAISSVAITLKCGRKRKLLKEYSKNTKLINSNDENVTQEYKDKLIKRNNKIQRKLHNKFGLSSYGGRLNSKASTATSFNSMLTNATKLNESLTGNLDEINESMQNISFDDTSVNQNLNLSKQEIIDTIINNNKIPDGISLPDELLVNLPSATANTSDLLSGLGLTTSAIILLMTLLINNKQNDLKESGITKQKLDLLNRS